MYLISTFCEETKVLKHGTFGADNIRLAVAKAIAQHASTVMEEQKLDDILHELIKGFQGTKEVCSKYGYVVEVSTIGIHIV